MDYEKAYNEALERAKNLENTTTEEDALIKYIFPELRESEDERIRKAIVLGIKRCADAGSIFGTVINNEGVNYHDVLTYLEKQKDANKEYWRGYREGKQEILDKYTEIEKQKEQNTEPFSCGHEKGGNSEKPNSQWDWEDDVNLNAIIEALRWCNNEGMNPNDIDPEYLISWLKFIRPQPKQKLSEEDEGMLNCIIATLCEESHGGREANEKMVNWLENRLKFLRPQPKQKDRYQEGFQDGVYEEMRKALEEYNKSVAFHYEDFNHKLSCYEGGPCTNPHFDCFNCLRRGNSVVKTYTSPNTNEYQLSTQPHWKPSEEQMKAFKWTLHSTSITRGADTQQRLESLYEELKKL